MQPMRIENYAATLLDCDLNWQRGTSRAALAHEVW